jgi:ABC-2 type transport system permease protein
VRQWSGFLALVRATWLSWLQARSFFFLLAFGWMVPPLIYLFVWSTAAGSGVAAPGGLPLSRGHLVAYYLALIVVNQLTYAQTHWVVGDAIRDGSLSLVLLRPMAPVVDTLASEMAGKGVFLLFVLPVVALLGWGLEPELPAVTPAFWAALPALFLAWALRFLWGYWLALLAFWSTRAAGLLAIQDALIFLLAGQVAPVSLLPAPLQTAATMLPFRYMLGFPVELFMGQVEGAAIWLGFAVQLGWLSLAFGLSLLLWRVGLRRYAAVGG